MLLPAPLRRVPLLRRANPQEAADKQLCAEWNTDSAQGDIQAAGEAAQRAEGSASSALVNDILYTVNNPGSIQQDEWNDVYIAMDCGIVAADQDVHDKSETTKPPTASSVLCAPLIGLSNSQSVRASFL